MKGQRSDGEKEHRQQQKIVQSFVITLLIYLL